MSDDILGTCPVFAKRAFASRAAAQDAMFEYGEQFPGSRLAVYQCQNHWHFGHQDQSPKNSANAKRQNRKRKASLDRSREHLKPRY